MGWLHLSSATKKDVIKELQTHRNNQETDTVKYQQIASSVRGNVLWSVVERTDKATLTTRRFIACDLLRSGGDKFGWGYKDMDESVHPSYHSCPLSYLELAPEVDCEEWRVKVREYHARRNQKLSVGQRLKLVNSSIPYVDIRSVKPLQGFYNGLLYRVPKKFIGEIMSQ